MKKLIAHIASGSSSTVLFYLAVILALLIIAGYSSRHVLFEPWTARISMTVASAPEEQTIFAVGGRRTNETLLDTVIGLQAADERIYTAATAATPLLGAAAAVAEDTLYILGGDDGQTFRQEILGLSFDGQEMSTVGTLPSPRAYGAAAAFRGSIYYFGGWNGSRKMDQILRFDPGTEKARVIGTLPEARERMEAVTLNDSIYLLGGYDADNRGNSVLLRFDPSTGEVSAVRKLPEPVDKASAAAFRGTLAYLTSSGNRSGVLHRFNPLGEGTSPTRQTVPLNGRQVALASLGDTLYAVGDSHPRFERQIGVWRINFSPESGSAAVTPVRFRGVSWR
jgi:hypothetical protein